MAVCLLLYFVLVCRLYAGCVQESVPTNILLVKSNMSLYILRAYWLQNSYELIIHCLPFWLWKGCGA